MSITNINDWTKNITPPTFQNTYSDGHNTLRYKGGGGHERIYYAVTIPKSNLLKFSLKFCSPTGYSCSYGDSQEYIVIFGNQPSSTDSMTNQTILARTAVSGVASETPVLYTVTYANTSGADKTVYLGIDWGYIVDGVEITLRYDDIQAELIFNGWVLNENNQLELTNGQLAAEIPGDIFTREYPATFWRLDSNNVLTLNSEDWSPFPEPINDILTPPYPASFWYLDEGNKLQNALLPAEPAEGSFMDCTTLEYVSIPESVQYIGKYAFTHTSLTRVRISRTCTYFPTSFPSGCEIWFYDEELNAEESYTKADTDDLLNAKQDKLSADNKLDPDYIAYNSSHRAVSDSEKNVWNGKQSEINDNNKLGGNIVVLTGYTAEVSPSTWAVPAATDTLDEAVKKLDNNTRLNQTDISALTSAIADLQARVTALES